MKINSKRKHKVNGFKGRQWGAEICVVLSFVFVLVLTASAANAFEVYNKPECSDWTVRWDNTIKYSMNFRVADRDNDLISDANIDDGDRNFHRGLQSSRWDILSEFDATFRKNWGVHVSGAGWVDNMYLRDNANNSPATFNGTNLKKHNQFDNETVDIHGRNIELLDAFVFGKGTLGSMPASFKLGRHSLLWGETLFFASNGIAYGMAPQDVVKLASVPSTQAKELFMPIARFSGQLELAPNVTLAGFWNMEWRRTRLPAVGSYYSDGDILDAGGRRMLLTENNPIFPDGLAPAFWRGKDLGGGGRTGGFGELDFDSFGTALRFRVPGIDCDWGLYYHRFNDTSSQVYTHFGKATPNDMITKNKMGEYYLVFPKHIQTIGASFGTQVGEWNVSGEFSGRLNQPLISGGQGSGMLDVSMAPDADNNHHNLYAVGSTLHANVSAMYSLPSGPKIGSVALWQSAMFMAEIGWQQLVHITDKPEARMLNRGGDHHAVKMQAVFDPMYYQVLPNLDLDVPISFGYNPSGTSAIDIPWREDSGFFMVGLNYTYRTVWKGGISYTNYFGPASKATLADRDGVAITMQYSF